MNTKEIKRKTIDARTYDAVKILLESGASKEEIAVMLKIGAVTVGRIKSSQSFEEYKADRSAWYFAQKKAAQEKEAKKAAEAAGAVPASQLVPKDEPPKQVVEYRQSVTIQATHYMETELKKHTELLTQISNKLAAIIEDLYGVKEAK